MMIMMNDGDEDADDEGKKESTKIKLREEDYYAEGNKNKKNISIWSQLFFLSALKHENKPTESKKKHG